MDRNDYITADDLREAAARTGGVVGLAFVGGSLTAWVQEEDSYYDVEVTDESPWLALQGAVERYLQDRPKPGTEG